MTTTQPLRNTGIRSLKPGFSILCLSILFVLICSSLSAQICDRKVTVYFDSDKYAVSPTEVQKLRNLARGFSQETDTFLLEIYAFTDSIASDQYNYRLAENRFKSIATFLKKNATSHLKFIQKLRGEAKPMSSNATEEGRAKNRRVEIFYFKTNGGLVALRGKGGMEMWVGRDYFGSKGICECNPCMSEIFTNEQARAAGISLVTTDGGDLITGGMMMVSFEGQTKDWCKDVVIKIPASKYDPEMEIWNSAPLDQGRGMSGWSREQNGQLEYDEKTKLYTLTVRYCAGSMMNLDKLVNSRCCRDTSGVVALPDLVRTNKGRNYRIFTSTTLNGDAEKTVTMGKFSYKGRGSVLFADSGMSKEKIGYYFSGSLDNYERECDSGRCSRLRECWCYELPLSAYNKVIYFQKKKYSLKVPVKYRNYSVKLFIPGADSIIPVTNVTGSRKNVFHLPVPGTYVVLYKENANPNDKRGYEYKVDLDQVRKKYSKRNKVYKAKIKGRQLKHSV